MSELSRRPHARPSIAPSARVYLGIE